MIPKEQRIAIAEACGWTKGYDWSRSDGIGVLPDYLNDLNAMHEAEKALDGMDQLTYLAKLHEGNHYCSWAGTCATAAQRAEAFLKTIGKWKEPCNL
jgi:hypothetical protein